MSVEDFNKVFSNRLRYYMKKNDMTQKELADRLGVGVASVSFWCNGIKSPRMDKVDKMCAIFNCNRSDLIEDKPTAADQPEPPLSPSDIAHLKKYNQLDDIDKIKVDERIDTLLEDDKYHKKTTTLAG